MQTNNLNILSSLQAGEDQLIASTYLTPADSFTKLLTHFDGAALDASGNNRQLTNNSVTFTSTPISPLGNGFGSFNGSSYLVSTSNFSGTAFGTNDFTIEFWTNMNAQGSQVIFLAQYAGDFNNYFRVVWYPGSPNKISVEYYVGGTGYIDVQVPVTIGTGTWFHFAFVSHSNVFAGYINGVSQTLTINHQTNNSPGLSLPLDVGVLFNPSATQILNGYMEEVRISNGVARYTSNFTPPTSDLTSDGQTALLLHFNGNFADSSSTNLTFTNTGVTIPTIFGQAASFNGTSSYLTVPDSTDLNVGSGWTFEAWIYPTSNSGTGCIFDRGNGASTQFRLAFNNNQVNDLTLYEQDSSSQILNVNTPANSITLNTWQHVAVTWNGTTWAIYINGINQTLTTVNGHGPTNPSGNQGGTLFIGQTGGNNTWFPGYMDELRISNTVRYSSNFTPANAPFIGSDPLTSLTFSGLNGDNDVVYYLKVSIVNGSSTGPDTALRFNGDTGSNYTRMWMYGTGSSVLSSSSTNDRLYGSGLNPGPNNRAFEDWTIFSKSGVVKPVLASHLMQNTGTTISQLNNYSGVWNNSTSPITSITYFVDVTNGIGTGSLIELWARKNSYQGISGIDGYTKLMLHLDNNVLDSSLFPKTVTNNSTTFSLGNSPVQKTVLSFSGSTNDYLTITPGGQTQWAGTTTLDFWIYLPTVPAGGANYLIWETYNSNSSPNNNHRVFYSQYYTGDIDLFCYNNGILLDIGTASNATPLSAGQWNHVAIVQNGTTYYIFINGVSQPLTVHNGSTSNSISIPANDVYIGGTNPGSQYGTMSLSEVRMSNIARWTSNFIPPTSPYPIASAQVLLVAGGGGGGYASSGASGAGGGGAGGFLYNASYNFVPGKSYPIVVGAGGLGGTTLSYNGSNGTNSTFDALTAIGGGGGASENAGPPYNAFSGGSGGGSVDGNISGDGIPGSGVSGQGNSGGIGDGAGNAGGGGGGGATSAGGNGTNSVGGNGGSGAVSSISGSSVTYAGGGGAGAYSVGTNGTGGSGGGGNGGGGNATPNTGGGGGGGHNSNGGNGGSGIVIIAYPTSMFSADGTGGTITHVGGMTIHTFTSSGTFVAPSGPALIDSDTQILLHLNENLTDSSENNFSVTNNNSSGVVFNTSKFGYSALFNGSSGYLQIPDSSDWNLSNSDFTIECWIYPTVAFGTYQIFYCNGVNSGTENSFAITPGGKLEFFCTNGGSNEYDLSATGNTLTLNTWQHVAVVRHGSNWYLFVNGVAQTTTASGIASSTFANKGGGVFIGRRENATLPFGGYIDEFRFSNGIARWTSAFTPPTCPYTL